MLAAAKPMPFSSSTLPVMVEVVTWACANPKPANSNAAVSSERKREILIEKK
jgi:hypothetical protein